MPINESDIKCNMNITQPGLKEKTMEAVVQALKKSDMAEFTSATLTFDQSSLTCYIPTLISVSNTLHTSSSDPREHITVRLTTPAQSASKTGQAVHIYRDQNDVYEGHLLWPERKNKKKKPKR